MRAILFTETGGPDVLRPLEVDEPAPGPEQVVIEVAAAGVNFIDTYQRSGKYPLSLPSGIGLEVAGTVTAAGDAVTDRSVGDRVACPWTGTPGAYAEQVAVDAARTVIVPAQIDFETATAAMLQGLTAHFLTSSTAELGPDDTVLVWAAAGGVGRLVVQMAKRRGAQVFGCTSTVEKADEVTRLGADAVIRYRDANVVSHVRELTDSHGVNVVYDSVGAASFEDSLASLSRRGLLVLFGASSGPVPPMDPQTLSRHGSLFLTRPSLPDYLATPAELAWRANEVFEMILDDKLDISIHQRYRLDEAAAAHEDLASGATSGKLLLLP